MNLFTRCYASIILLILNAVTLNAVTLNGSSSTEEDLDYKAPVTLNGSSSTEEGLDYKALYLAEQQARLAEQNENYVLRCGQSHRYAVKYFEWIISRAQEMKLVNFAFIKVQVKNSSFEVFRQSNATVSIRDGTRKKINDLTDLELKAYRALYFNERLTQKEKWEILPAWLATSDEYKQVTNGDLVRRLELLAETIRSYEDPALAAKSLTACILRHWDRLSNIVKVEPFSFDYKPLIDAFHALAEQPSYISKFCTFLLESIIRKVPLTDEEKKNWKTWSHDVKIQFESWELDPHRAGPGVSQNKSIVL